MLSIVVGILIFSLMVIVHEYGHYKAAKSVGIGIEEFAIGMGPIIYKKEKNNTKYTIRLFPIGGYVAMEGEEEEIKSSTSYSSKLVWQRFVTIAAGPMMNFVLAVVLFLILAFSYGISGTVVDYIDESSNEYAAGMRTGDKIISVNDKKAYIWEDIYYEITNEERDSYTVKLKRDNEIKEFDIGYNYRNIIGITPADTDDAASNRVSPTDVNSSAYKAGIKDGDKVVKVNDKTTATWDELRNEINSSKSESVKLTVERDGKTIDINVASQKQAAIAYNTKIEKSFGTAIFSSIYKTGYYIKLMFEVIGMLITGQIGTEAFGGPVSVISMVGKAAKVGMYSLLNLAAFISVNLGFMNLLPIPALDGSKLVFLIYEKIRGKKIPAEKEGFIHFIGFVLLISFMLFITYKDIVKLFRL